MYAKVEEVIKNGARKLTGRIKKIYIISQNYSQVKAWLFILSI